MLKLLFFYLFWGFCFTQNGHTTEAPPAPKARPSFLENFSMTGSLLYRAVSMYPLIVSATMFATSPQPEQQCLTRQNTTIPEKKTTDCFQQFAQGNGQNEITSPHTFIYKGKSYTLTKLEEGGKYIKWKLKRNTPSEEVIAFFNYDANDPNHIPHSFDRYKKETRSITRTEFSESGIFKEHYNDGALTEDACKEFFGNPQLVAEALLGGAVEITLESPPPVTEQAPAPAPAVIIVTPPPTTTPSAAEPETEAAKPQPEAQAEPETEAAEAETEAETEAEPEAETEAAATNTSSYTITITSDDYSNEKKATITAKVYDKDGNIIKKNKLQEHGT